MKKSLSLICLTITIQMAVAQKDTCMAGVFLTYNDFLNNKLTNKIDTKIKGNKFGFILFKETIKVITPETKIKYAPGSIYGYYYCGMRYRYSPGGELYAPEDYYKIEEMDGIVIYSSVFWGGSEYFYSKDLSTPIHRLNMSNLEKDFGDNTDFMTAVRKSKSRSDGLSKHNKNNHFTINSIYTETIKKQTP
jgi:outer membrane pore protein E